MSLHGMHSNNIIRSVFGLTVQNDHILTSRNQALFLGLLQAQINQIINDIKRGDLVDIDTADQGQLAHQTVIQAQSDDLSLGSVFSHQSDTVTGGGEGQDDGGFDVVG